MGLFDKFKKVYAIKAKCYNCGHVQDLNIPKGNTIDSFLTTEGAICSNCGNATLRRAELANVKIKQVMNNYNPSRRNIPITTQIRPRPRPQPPIKPKPRPQQIRPQPPQVVEYPAPEEVYKEPEDDFGLKPKRINMWTGREE